MSAKILLQNLSDGWCILPSFLRELVTQARFVGLRSGSLGLGPRPLFAHLNFSVKLIISFLLVFELDFYFRLTLVAAPPLWNSSSLLRRPDHVNRVTSNDSRLICVSSILQFSKSVFLIKI